MDLLAAERGTLHKQAETRIALMYPSPYRAAMSSLGYQQIYRVLHAMPGVAADRAMLPEPGDPARGGAFVTLETARPVGGYPMLAYSVAYELEIAGVVETLERAGVPVLAADRDARHPLVIAGGPLTFSNPAPLAPFFDLVVLGEGEQLVSELVEIAREVGFVRERGRVRERQRPARDDQRMVILAILAQHGNARELERLDDARDLELVRDRVREHRIAADRLPGLERLEPARCLRQHRAIGGDVRHRVERAIDLLVAERAHRRAIRARIHERDPRLGFLEQRAALGGQQHVAIHQ